MALLQFSNLGFSDFWEQDWQIGGNIGRLATSAGNIKSFSTRGESYFGKVPGRFGQRFRCLRLVKDEKGTGKTFNAMSNLNFTEAGVKSLGEDSAL